MLLVQPLRPDEINIKLRDDEPEETKQPVMIDDIELLNILNGLFLMPPPVTVTTPAPVNEECILFDWDSNINTNMPTNKRKRDEDDVDDIFAHLDFVDVILPPTPKKPFIQQ